jgi:hypothetical protein
VPDKESQTIHAAQEMWVIESHTGRLRIFDGFAFEEVETTYTLGGGNAATQASELIISGGDRPSGLFAE